MTRRKMAYITSLQITAATVSGDNLSITRTPPADIAVGEVSAKRMMRQLMEMFEHEIEKLASSR